MQMLRTAKRLVQVAARRTPRRLRRMVPAVVTRQVKRWVKPAPTKKKKPQLTVIIPVYNVAAYLPDCLTSVLNQSLKSLEVIIVDDGSTDGCPEIIAEFAAKDSRIRAFRQENTGQGPARNFAVSQSRGRFLTFLDADDIIPAGAYAYMVKELKNSGSDFSIGSVRRVKNGRLSEPAWNVPVHVRDRIGIVIDDFPVALQDVIACNRMFRRTFWVEKVGGFRGGMVYEDHVPMVAAYVRAEKFDVLAKVTYHWRIREDLTSTGQQKHALSNLRDRVEVKAEAWDILQQEASGTVRAAWVGRVLDTDFPPFIDYALVAEEEEYRSLLRDALAQYWSIADHGALRHVRLQQKFRGFLASKGAWDQIETVQRYFREGGSPPPARVVGNRILATDELTGMLAVQLPAEVCELSDYETALQTCLRQAEWTEDGRLRLTGWSYIKSLDFRGQTPLTDAWLVDLDSGERIDLKVESFADADATRWSGQRHANCDTSAFHTIIDAFGIDAFGIDASGIDKSRLPAAIGGERNWQLRMRVSVSGIVREGSVHHAVVGSSAASAVLRSRTITAAGLQAVPRFDPAAGLVVTMRQPIAVAVELGSTHQGRTLTGRMRSLDPQSFSPVKIRATERSDKSVVESAAVHQGDGTYRFALELPQRFTDEGALRASSWDLRVVSDLAATRFLEWPADLTVSRVESEGAEAAYWQRSPHGFVRPVLDCPNVQVTAVEVTGTEIRVTVDPGQHSADDLGTVLLANSTIDIPLLGRETDPAGRTLWRFPNAVAQFGLPARPLSRGGYWISFTDASGVTHQIGTAPKLQQSLPLEVTTAVHRVRFATTGADQLRVQFDAPLTNAERGNWAQAQQRRWYQDLKPTDDGAEPEASVLFQCYRGETATDSQVALHDGLHQRQSGLTLYWGVSDFATRLPEGAVPLLIGSRAWYQELASATYLCNNIDFDTFFVKRPHQRYLQTFHGYPFKSMGRTFWEGKGLSADRIAVECERRNREWDSILVPSDFCADLYRTEYGYAGEVLVSGYPRSDVLLSDQREAIAKRVRTGLGIHGEQTVILYAPTYRDLLTTRTYAAKRFDELDLDLLSEKLGETHVILVRGHNNNQRESERVRGRSRIIDVTDYPEINDLTLAADVAILDYSSLRFEWAITQKPMVFFVPDLETYFAQRPPLFEYGPTAPGPLLRSTEEVIETLQDLEQLTVEYAESIKRFNDEYNLLQDGHATDRVIEAFFGQ